MGRRRPSGVRITEAPRHAGESGALWRGADYHQVLWEKLGSLLDWLRSERPDAGGRAVSDTAPLLERDYARLAGLGWIGKNTMLISRRLGSFTFLGALLTDVELAYDVTHEANHCGTCTRCLDACPTDAFAGPYQLDARRCISYWTIEHRGMLADADAERLDGWVFGCDVCQDVCPWNRKAPSGRSSEFEARSEWVDPDLIEWLGREPRIASEAQRDGPIADEAHGNVAQCGSGSGNPALTRGGRAAGRQARRPGRRSDRPGLGGLGPGPDRGGRGLGGPRSTPKRRGPDRPRFGP